MCHTWRDSLARAGVPQQRCGMRDLTPFPGAKAQNVVTNKRFPDTLLVGINKRDPTKFDMYRCNLRTGELTLDTENPGDVLGWGAEDESFEVRRIVPEAMRARKARPARPVWQVRESIAMLIE